MSTDRIRLPLSFACFRSSATFSMKRSFVGQKEQNIVEFEPALNVPESNAQR